MSELCIDRWVGGWLGRTGVEEDVENEGKAGGTVDGAVAPPGDQVEVGEGGGGGRGGGRGGRGGGGGGERGGGGRGGQGQGRLLWFFLSAHVVDQGAHHLGVPAGAGDNQGGHALTEGVGGWVGGYTGREVVG